MGGCRFELGSICFINNKNGPSCVQTATYKTSWFAFTQRNKGGWIDIWFILNLTKHTLKKVYYNNYFICVVLSIIFLFENVDNKVDYVYHMNLYHM